MIRAFRFSTESRFPFRFTFKLGAAWLAIGPLATAVPGPAAAEGPAQAAEIAERAAQRAAHREADLRELREELKRASDFLAKQPSFQFDADLGYDIVQSTGQKLEFGGERSVTVRRPDRARAAAHIREGGETTLYFDGESIKIDLPGDEAYVSVKKPGTLDVALDYLENDLGAPAPLADLMYSDFYAGIADQIVSGFVVGESRIAGHDCLHLSFSSDAVDVQLWVDDSDRPLPRRIVITYKTAEGSPQLWADFASWNLEAETPDSLFEFTPNEGAELLPISVAVGNARRAQEGE